MKLPKLSDHRQGIVAALATMVVGLMLGSLLPPPAPAPPKAGQDKQHLAADKAADSNANGGPTKPSAPALDQQNAEPTNGPHKNEGDKHQDDSSSNWWGIVNAVLMVLFTGVLAAVAYLQWLAMREQGVHMRTGLALTQAAVNTAHESARIANQTLEHMRNEQRAWLTLFDAEISELTVGTKAKCKITIKNTGPSPGAVTGREFIFCMAPPTEEGLEAVLRKLSNPPLKGLQHVVPPDDRVILTVYTDDDMDEQMLNSIQNVTQILVLVGRFLYDAVPGRPRTRTTQCCFVYNPDIKILGQHDLHNYMT